MSLELALALLVSVLALAAATAALLLGRGGPARGPAPETLAGTARPTERGAGPPGPGPGAPPARDPAGARGRAARPRRRGPGAAGADGHGPARAGRGEDPRAGAGPPARPGHGQPAPARDDRGRLGEPRRGRREHPGPRAGPASPRSPRDERGLRRTVVEYALRLPGGRLLPIDSKWTSADEPRASGDQRGPWRAAAPPRAGRPRACDADPRDGEVPRSRAHAVAGGPGGARRGPRGCPRGPCRGVARRASWSCPTRSPLRFVLVRLPAGGALRGARPRPRSCVPAAPPRGEACGAWTRRSRGGCPGPSCSSRNARDDAAGRELAGARRLAERLASDPSLTEPPGAARFDPSSGRG